MPTVSKFDSPACASAGSLRELSPLELPSHVLVGLTPDEIGLAKVWWGRLENDFREALLALWCRWPHSRKKIEVQVVAEFTEEAEINGVRWPVELSRYLANHEARVAETGAHIAICTGHVATRDAIHRGVFPADFACPLKLKNCIMREALALAPGRHLRLAVTCRLLAADGTAVAEL